MAIELKDLHSLEIRERFQRNLSTIRKLFNWSAEKLGNKMEVSKQSIWKWEKIDYDDDGHIKKPMTFAQYLTLFYIIQDELVNMKTENIGRWIYVNGLCRLLMKEDNVEVEKKIAVYADVNYSGDLELKDTLPLISESVIESAKRININELKDSEMVDLKSLKNATDDKELLKEVEKINEKRLDLMSRFIIKQDLDEKFNELYDLIIEIQESIKNKTFVDKYNNLLNRYKIIDEKFAKITECNIKVMKKDIFYTYLAISGLMSFTKLFFELFTCNTEEAILIIKKIDSKRQEYTNKISSDNYTYEEYKKDKFSTSIMFCFKNIHIKNLIEQWIIANKVEKNDLQYMIDCFMKEYNNGDNTTKKSNKIEEYTNMFEKEFSNKEKGDILKNTQKLYGDIEKRFIEISGDKSDEVLKILDRYINLSTLDDISLTISDNFLKKM